MAEDHINGTPHKSLGAIRARYSASQRRSEARRAPAEKRLAIMQRRQRVILILLAILWLTAAAWVGYSLVH